jgi:hypothetical protein
MTISQHKEQPLERCGALAVPHHFDQPPVELGDEAGSQRGPDLGHRGGDGRVKVGSMEAQAQVASAGLGSIVPSTVIRCFAGTSASASKT